jgi:hypothetical protein
MKPAVARSAALALAKKPLTPCMNESPKMYRKINNMSNADTNEEMLALSECNIVCKVLVIALHGANTLVTLSKRMMRNILNVRKADTPDKVDIAAIAATDSTTDDATMHESNRFQYLSLPTKNILCSATMRSIISAIKSVQKIASKTGQGPSSTVSPLRRRNSFETSRLICRPRYTTFAKMTIEHNIPNALHFTMWLLSLTIVFALSASISRCESIRLVWDRSISARM